MRAARRSLTGVATGLLVVGLAAPAGAQTDEPSSTTTTTTPAATTTTAPTTTAPTTTTPTTTTPTTTTTPPPPAPAPATPEATPTLKVRPATDLVHRQVVAVKGKGYTPGASIGMSQCEAGAVDLEHCDLANIGYATADGDGRWRTTFTVRRAIQNAYEVVDCTVAPGACIIGAANVANLTGEHAEAPLAFDPTAPPPPPPTLKVRPATDLVHRQVVTVKGKGYTPGASIGMSQCEAGATDIEGCDLSNLGYATADGDGSWRTTFAVRRAIRNSYEVVDCTSAPDACVISAANIADQTFEHAEVPLAFDPAFPPPPPPVVTVTPDTDLVHDQEVRVKGRGFKPSHTVRVTQCTEAADPYPACAYLTAQYVDVGPAGGFSVTVPVSRVIGLFAEPPFDCATAPGACVVSVESTQDPVAFVEVPLAFDPDVPLPPPPVVTVTPNTGLTENQRVTITGTGFAPRAEIQVVECAAEGDPYPACEYATARYVTADRDGEFRTATRVRGSLRSPFGTDPTDCAAAVGTCVMRVLSYDDPLAFAEIALGFLPPVPE